MKEFVEKIVCQLVDNPDKVSVIEVEGERTTVIELRVAKEDLGKVIGREGRIAKAMRVLLSAATSREQKKCALEIIED
ncbi:MAG TPA: KH domain-containing protein [bacterium]|nr:KH domain-containing protein [bacterium]HPS30841.1 KH domain-containing protein [bacterium]